MTDINKCYEMLGLKLGATEKKDVHLKISIIYFIMAAYAY